MTKFTPGPWNLFDAGERPGIDAPGQSIVVYGEDGEQYAGVLGADGNEARANAHLIAASPDMYEALKAFAAENPPEGMTFKQWVRGMSDRLIAKAEGR